MRNDSTRPSALISGELRAVHCYTRTGPRPHNVMQRWRSYRRLTFCVAPPPATRSTAPGSHSDLHLGHHTRPTVTHSTSHNTQPCILILRLNLRPPHRTTHFATTRMCRAPPLRQTCTDDCRSTCVCDTLPCYPSYLAVRQHLSYPVRMSAAQCCALSALHPARDPQTNFAPTSSPNLVIECPATTHEAKAAGASVIAKRQIPLRPRHRHSPPHLLCLTARDPNRCVYVSAATYPSRSRPGLCVSSCALATLGCRALITPQLP
jgi:hypothetical protein